jgi:hypothetical protein
MNKIKLVAIDLAKRCYQVGATDEHGKMIYRKLSPAKFALAMRWAGKHEHAQSRWIKSLVARRGKNKVSV